MYIQNSLWGTFKEVVLTLHLLPFVFLKILLNRFQLIQGIFISIKGCNAPDFREELL